MVLSMTGFGRGEAADEKYKITVEMKSVNHRYLYINVRMPHKFSFYEGRIRSMTKEYASRGKVDIYVSYENFNDSDIEISYNNKIANAYIEGVRQLALEHSMKFKTDAYQIASLPDVFTMKDAAVDEDEVTALIETAFRQAGEQLRKSRMAEGEILATDLKSKLDSIKKITDLIEKRYPDILKEYAERIHTKAKEILSDRQIDERVLATEMIVYADKLCVDEEMVRLKTHIKNMYDTLEESENIGRKLDFLTQELNREANTILSKSTDITIANYGIDLKTDIEKIREQIQNIE